VVFLFILFQFFKEDDAYFPMQKLAKILPSSSSLVTSPVISPKKYKALLMSIAIKSDEIPASKPHFTF